MIGCILFPHLQMTGCILSAVSGVYQVYRCVSLLPLDKAWHRLSKGGMNVKAQPKACLSL